MFPTFDFNKMLISQHMFSWILFLQWLQIVFSFLNKHFYFNFFVDFDLNPKLLTRGKPKQRNFCEQKIRIRRFRICENVWWTRYKSAKQRKRMVSMNKSLLLQLVNSEWLPLQFQVFLKIYFAMQYIVSFEHLEKSIGQIEKLRMLQNLRFLIYMSNENNSRVFLVSQLIFWRFLDK